MRTEQLAALAFAGMGALALARPNAIPQLMGLSIDGPTGQNEVRAVYGGFGLAVAASLVTGSAEHRAGARRNAGVALLGMASGRVADLGLGGQATATGIAALAGEAMLGTALLSGR